MIPFKGGDISDILPKKSRGIIGGCEQCKFYGGKKIYRKSIMKRKTQGRTQRKTQRRKRGGSTFGFSADKVSGMLGYDPSVINQGQVMGPSGQVADIGSGMVGGSRRRRRSRRR